MKKADIKTGFLCNNNCLFCVQGDQKKALGNKSVFEIKDLIKEASQDCGIIVFTGGEVTIRNDLIELVRYASGFGFQTIQIQSNGRAFVYPDLCRDIIQAGANEFALALHGHIPQLHNFLTQTESFHQTVQGIRNLKNLGQKVLMNTVITKSNYRHLPDITKLLISLEVDHVQFAFVHALGAAALHFDRVVPRMKLAAPYVIKSLDIAKHFGKEMVTEAIPYCMLPGYEYCIAEDSMPVMKIFEHNHIIENFTDARLKESKAKGPDCSACRYYQRCEGLWKEYPEAFGWKECVPVSPD